MLKRLLKTSSNSQALNDMSLCNAGPWITRKLPRTAGLSGSVTSFRPAKAWWKAPNRSQLDWERQGRYMKMIENVICIAILIIFEKIIFLWFVYLKPHPCRLACYFNSTSFQPQSCRKNCINSISSKRKLIKAQSCQCGRVQLGGKEVKR